MADEEKKERVSLEDVVGVLAKHSPVPNDPDDAQLIGDYNAQQAEEQEPDEGTKDSSTAKTPSTSATGARREKP